METGNSSHQNRTAERAKKLDKAFWLCQSRPYQLAADSNVWLQHIIAELL